MTGVGRIYDDYRTGALDADDEVAVLQDSSGRALTCALVNVRAALDRAHADQQVTRAEAVALLRLARAIPCARRTWALLSRAAAQDEALADALGRLDRWRRTHPYDLKREDAEQALALLAADPELHLRGPRDLLPVRTEPEPVPVQDRHDPAVPAQQVAVLSSGTSVVG